MRLPKIGPRRTTGLFEEYLYGFLVGIWLFLSLLLKAGGMSSSDAMVIGLWVAGFAWFAWQVKRYFKEKSSPAPAKKPAQTAKTPKPAGKMPLSPNMKPMIGPQWPLKTAQRPSPSTREAPQGKKPVFVYERPTLPDRKPKLPANWSGRQDKKPKQ